MTWRFWFEYVGRWRYHFLEKEYKRNKSETDNKCDFAFGI